MDARTALEGFPLVVIAADAEFRITGWNDHAERIFGTEAAGAVGCSLGEVLPLAVGDWSEVLAGGSAPKVWSIRRPDAAWSLEAWSRVALGAEGRPTKITVIGHDVSARVAAEARASLEHTIYQAIKENLELVVWAVDEQGTFLYQDGKAHAQAGVPRNYLIGHNIFELYKGTGNAELIARAIAGEPAHVRSAELHGHFWDTSYLPVRDEASGARLIGITLNITEIKRAEMELRERLEVIERQQEVIRELATPIIEVWDGVLTMPIVGMVDTARSAAIMDGLLQAVTRTRARFAILDLTGVEVVDTNTASHLISMISAVRLLGAEGILTGIHPTIAQTVVELGIDLSRLVVHAKLRDALKYCIRALGPRRV